MTVDELVAYALENTHEPSARDDVMDVGTSGAGSVRRDGRRPAAGAVALGTEVSFVAGQEMSGEGRPADFWWVLLEGRVDLVRHVGREETLLGSMDVPGRWAGGFRAWDEHGAYLATGRASTAGRFFCVPAEDLGGWATTWFPLGVHLIEGLFRTARNFESTTRQKEALIALGTLAAGLAHQLNNPAAAATRAADGARGGDRRRCWSRSVGSPRRGHGGAVRRTRHPAAGDHASSRPRRIRGGGRPRGSVADWLASHGVAHPWGPAAALARAGADVTWCDQVAASWTTPRSSRVWSGSRAR